MNSIIRFSIEKRGLVLLITAAFAMLGLAAFQSLPIDAVPDVTNVQVQINTQVPGLIPEESERTVTIPIEIGMRGIGGVTQIRSHTRFGLSQVTVVFEEGMSIFLARQMVAERLQGVLPKLPHSLSPRMGPVSTGLGEIYQYTVDFEKKEKGDARIRQLMELRTLQDWFIKPRLLTVKGLAEVNTIGGYEKEFHVQPDPDKMARFGIQFSDIHDALERTNKNVGGSYVQQTAEQFLVQSTGLFRSAEDIKHVPVKSLHTLRVVRIGDIAAVNLGKELRTGAALSEQGETVLGTAMMLLGENSRTVSTRVAARMEEIQKELPPGVQIKPVYSRNKLVNATLHTVEHNLLVGAALVVLVLLLLVGNIRAALITAITIPLTLLMTFLIMKPLGLSGNLMSLGALDFGIIVDGTVIVLDNCVRVLHERAHELKRTLKTEEVKEAIYDATTEIREAAGFGQLIIVLIFAPVFVLDGVAGKMFRPMASTFIIAVFVALVMSFTTAPALATVLLGGKAEEKEPRLMGYIKEFYGLILRKSLKKRTITMVGALLSVVLGAFLFSRLGGEFIPQLNEGSLDIDVIRPANTSIDQSLSMQAKTEEVIRSFPEVRFTYSRIGTAEVATDAMGVNQADTYVIFWDRDEWKSKGGTHTGYGDLIDAIDRRMESEIPGQRFMISQPIQMRFNELLEGTRAAIAIKIFGSDMTVLTDIAHKVKQIISVVPGAGDLQTEFYGTSRMLKVVPKYDLLGKLGVSTDELQETVSMAMSGEEAGYIYDGERRYPIMVRLDDTHRDDLEDFRMLPVGIFANATLPLSEVANISFGETHGLILRENGQRRTAVLVNTRGRDTESFVNEAQKLVEKGIQLPPGYRIEWGGDFKNLKEARARLAYVTPFVLILVLSIIYAAFQNMFQTILVFSCVPLALVGGVLGLMAKGLPFSVSAGVGFIALSGIAVLNGVVLMNYFNDLHRKNLKGEKLVEQGTQIRLRPVLMTALVDIFGFLPMVFSQGVGAEVQSPLASVVVGGIISSTILTLIVLPVLYCVFEKRMKVSS